MALEKFELANNPFDATVNRKLLIPLNADFYQLHIAYNTFTPGAGTGFKLHRSVGSNPTEASFSLIASSEQLIADASGTVVYQNELPERADFLMLEYTADTNGAGSNYSLTKNIR